MCLRNNAPPPPPPPPPRAMEQILDPGTTLVYRRNNETDHEHPRSTNVSTAPTDLWKM